MNRQFHFDDRVSVFHPKHDETLSFAMLTGCGPPCTLYLSVTGPNAFRNRSRY